MTADSMSCAEAEPLLPLVADGAIDPDSDPTLFAHLAACPDCQRMVASHDLIALAIARAPAPRRASVLRLWPWAAAAGLVMALGLALGATGSASPSAPQPASAKAPSAIPPVAAPPTAVAASAPTAPVALPDVIAIPRGDGSTVYLVRRGEAWVPVDPHELDGPVQHGPGGGSGVQVRY